MKYSNTSSPLDSLEYHQYLEKSKLYFVNYLKMLLKNETRIT